MHEGIRTLPCPHSVDETVGRLKALFQQKGIKLFAVVDHSGEAEAAGLTMLNTRLLIFGSPSAGTPLMLAAPSTALDLPLRLLVAEAPDGTTLLSWNDPAWLQQRHNFPAELVANLGAAQALAIAAAKV